MFGNFLIFMIIIFILILFYKLSDLNNVLSKRISSMEWVINDLKAQIIDLKAKLTPEKPDKHPPAAWEKTAVEKPAPAKPIKKTPPPIPPQMVEKPIKETKEPVKETVEEPIEKSLEEVIDEPFKEVVEEPFEEVIDEPFKEVVEEPLEDVIEAYPSREAMDYKPKAPPSPAPPASPEGHADREAPLETPMPDDAAKPESGSMLNYFKDDFDWEIFTGTKLFAWLGVLAMLVGAGFFVKYSIDNNLIPASLRLAIGAVLGIICIIGSTRINNERYAIGRQTLASAGICVLYTVVFAATLYYQFIPRFPGFMLLSVVSAASFVLALYHRAISISILGAIGAYLTPVLVSSGQGNFVLLFVYLSIVNIGLLKVVIDLESMVLLLIAAIGTMITLSLGAFFGSSIVPATVIAWVFIGNLILFSLLIGFVNKDPAASKSFSWAGNILYLSTLLLALFLINRSGPSPLLIVTIAMACAVVLALRNQGWHSRVIPYAVCCFMIAMYWAFKRFSADDTATSMILFLIFGVVGGLGPVVLIKKYGVNRQALNWLKTFPVAVALLSIIVLFKSPVVSFWFWPMLLGLQIIGIGISLLFGAIFQVGMLTVLLVAGGIAWILKMPLDFIDARFFMFILLAGAGLCVTTFYVIKKLPEWLKSLNMSSENTDPFKTHPGVTEWMVASPVMGAFMLLAVVFMVQKPLNPMPGMATLFCILSLALYLCKRLNFQPLGAVALMSAVFAQLAWEMNPSNSSELFFMTIAWSGVFFAGSLITPFAVFRSFSRWNQVWMTWAIFEVFQGFFIFWGADHLYSKPVSSWLPLGLAFLKLPVVAIMLKKLHGMEERNSILAFHGGALLFYISSLPVLLFDQGWLGITLVFESAALLWLNRRIEHPGLRWVSFFMAPVGLLLVLSTVTTLKGPDSLPILNQAVFSLVACIAALAAGVWFAGFPDRMLKNIDLRTYFLWLAVGTGFFLANLIISDLFSTPTDLFKINPGENLLQLISYSLVWVMFGAALWCIRMIPIVMRATGLVLLWIGFLWLISIPFNRPEAIAAMSPLLNLGLLAYLPVMALLYFLVIKGPQGDIPVNMKNIFLAMLLVAGFIFFKIEKSTIFQPGMPFMILFGHTASMSLSSSAGWIAYGLGMLLWPKTLDKPFRTAGIILILIGLVKSMMFPFRFPVEFGAMTPLLNSASLLYLFCLSCLAGLTLKKQSEQLIEMNLPGRPFWGVLLAVMAFFVLNIEIASVFGMSNRPFTLMAHGNLAHQLGYSIGWLVFSAGLLLVGIKWDTVKVRWAALLLLLFTSFKIFFKDLWALGQLYRVASFLGLAVVLIIVSFLYQRFLSGDNKHEE